MKNKWLTIGTRESPLAKWQAAQVSNLLAGHKCKNQLRYIKSDGDINLTQPIYEIGVQGVFTRSLDVALLNGQIDIAVHSYKDVPTQLAAGLTIAAVVKRGNPFDMLVTNTQVSFADDTLWAKQNSSPVIATSSIRRKAQWLHRYPDTNFENIRGNINTRLEKLTQSGWHGAIFAAAGLERLQIKNNFVLPLKWMLPAPAQGAVAVVCRIDDIETLQYCRFLNDERTSVCTAIEKSFLRTLMGGCSTPIGAYASIENSNILFNGNIVTCDGKKIARVSLSFSVKEYKNAGQQAADQLLKNGGEAIIESFNSVSQK